MLSLPLTNYTVWQIKKYSKYSISVIIIIFISINILTAVFKPGIKVNSEYYKLKNGYPLFTDSQKYIELIRTYPYDFGTEIKIYKLGRGESYWEAAKTNEISLDTLIAANPFIDTLLAKEGIEIVVPSEDGVLMALDNRLDVWRMSRLLGYKGKAKGDYAHSIFRLISRDDIKFVFFKDTVPVVVNDSLEKLYAMRQIFRTPIEGRYTSMYGDRVDPFLHGMAFHNGIDIKGRTGDPIYPAREGIVSFSGWKNNLGKTIIIQHRDGYETTYGHCSHINVKTGQWINKKDIIAEIGSTGRSTGPHLHFMIKHHGRLLNPLIFIW